VGAEHQSAIVSALLEMQAGFEVIYQTRERVFHQDIQTPRSGLKKRGAAEFF